MTSTGDEHVGIELDLRLRDAMGRPARLHGRFTSGAERYTPPCT